jgi:hypothetical protein
MKPVREAKAQSRAVVPPKKKKKKKQILPPWSYLSQNQFDIPEFQVM